jgi:flagellar motor protein MotB
MPFRAVSLVKIWLMTFYLQGSIVFAFDAQDGPPKSNPCSYISIRYAADFFFQQNQAIVSRDDIVRMSPILDASKRSSHFRGWETIVVIGHADPKERDSFELSTRRALVVKQLIEQFGVSPSVISSEGVGGKQPMGVRDARNRRVEVELIGKCGDPS